MAAAVPLRGRADRPAGRGEPPLRTHLHLIEQYLPLGVAQAAGALVALAGIGLMMLARGILRGQRRAWLVAIALLAATLVLHLVHGADVVSGLLVCAAVLALLIVRARAFRAQTDAGPLRLGRPTLAVGGVLAAVAARRRRGERPRPPPPPPVAGPSCCSGSAERLVGLQTVSFPPTVDDCVSPSLLAVGHRPGRGRPLPAHPAGGRPPALRRAEPSVGPAGRGRAAGPRHRAPPRHRHARLLRPARRQAVVLPPRLAGRLRRLRRRLPGLPRPHRPVLRARPTCGTPSAATCDRHGWGLGVMGAGEEWLPTYQASGMRHLYIGDEAVVDAAEFSLEGGKMKGLRQAVNRVARYGYTVRFLDPAHLDPARRRPLVELMAKQPAGRAGAGLLHDAGPDLRPPRHRPAPHRRRRPRRRPGRHVPVRALAGHRRLLARPHAPRPRRAPQRPARLRPVLHHRPPRRRWGCRASASTSPPCARSSRARPATA